MSAAPKVVRDITAGPNRPPLDPQGVRSAATSGLLALAVLYTMAIAAPILIPLTIGGLLSLILARPVNWLVRWRVPRPLAAAASVLVMLMVIGASAWLLAEPAATWIGDIPETSGELAAKVRDITSPIQEVQDVADEVEKLTQLDDGRDPVTVVKVEEPGMGEAILDHAPRIVASVGMAFFMMFLLLASGDAMLRKAILLVCGLTDTKRATLITRHIESDLFRYLATTTAINTTLGAVTAGLLYLMGVPNPLLWGVVAGLLNFAPIVGPFITIGILAMVGVTSFEETSRALSVPAMYFVLTSIEGQLLSPAIIGRRLSLSPVIVFIALVVLGWIWGIAGLLLAVPLLSSARIICANVPRLNIFAEFLGR